MLRQFNRFILLGIVVAAALYITLTNSDTATLRLGPQLTLTTYAGVIYLAVFAAGILVASVVALFFGIKGYLRERQLRSQQRTHQNFFKVQEHARDLMAAEDWPAARGLWEEIISREPDNLVARVELSKCIENLGDLRESLRVLETTRATSRTSQEVLFRAAQLNHTLGNNTATIDNLTLLLSNHPSRKAFELARDTSELLGRYEEALKYQDELERRGYISDDSNEIRAKLTFGQIMHDLADSNAQRVQLTALVKRYPSLIPALTTLADMELSAGNVEKSAEYLMKAARLETVEKNSLWRRIVELWLSHSAIDPHKRAERALAAARSATKDTQGEAQLHSELLLIRTLLVANHFQEAERALEAFPTLAQREVGKLPSNIEHELTILKGYCLAQTGAIHSTSELWRQLAEISARETLQSTLANQAPATSNEPSPTLSTP